MIYYRETPFSDNLIPLAKVDYKENGVISDFTILQLSEKSSLKKSIDDLYLKDLQSYLFDLFNSRQEVTVYYIKDSVYATIFTNQIEYIQYHTRTSTGYLKFERITHAA